MSHTRAIDSIAATSALARMPGHWVLARAGKRVLRPGGVELTDRLLQELKICSEDTVIELAPGLGRTACSVIAHSPMSYLGVEREPALAGDLNTKFGSDTVRFVEGVAEDTGLPGETATVVLGEALLSMHSEARKKCIVEEAWRVLRRNGRYGIHELCVSPCGLDPAVRKKMEADLALAIHHGVRLLTVTEWRELMESAGFRVRIGINAPMRLLEPARILRDEGICGTMRFATSVLSSPTTLQRVLSMRRAFHKYRDNLQAIAMVCDKDY